MLKGKHEEIINLSTDIDEIDDGVSILKTQAKGISLLLQPEYKPRLIEETKRWVLEIEERLKNDFNLVLKITVKARYFTFYTNNNDYVLRIILNRKKIIRTFFDLSPAQPEEKKIINEYSLKPNWWWRKNDHEFAIEDEKSFNQFFGLLKAFLVLKNLNTTLEN